MNGASSTSISGVRATRRSSQPYDAEPAPWESEARRCPCSTFAMRHAEPRPTTRTSRGSPGSAPSVDRAVNTCAAAGRRLHAAVDVHVVFQHLFGLDAARKLDRSTPVVSPWCDNVSIVTICPGFTRMIGGRFAGICPRMTLGTVEGIRTSGAAAGFCCAMAGKERLATAHSNAASHRFVIVLP